MDCCGACGDVGLCRQVVTKVFKVGIWILSWVSKKQRCLLESRVRREDLNLLKMSKIAISLVLFRRDACLYTNENFTSHKNLDFPASQFVPTCIFNLFERPHRSCLKATSYISTYQFQLDEKEIFIFHSCMDLNRITIIGE